MDKKMQEENKNKWAQIVTKAWMDPAFKQKLLSSPEAVFKEYGINCQGKACKVVEETSSEICLVLPSKPAGQLSDVELRNVAAGWASPSLGFSGAEAGPEA